MCTMREVGHRAVGVPQRPDDQHGVRDLVERVENRGRRGRRSHRAVGQPQARARRRTRRWRPSAWRACPDVEMVRGSGHQASATPSRVPVRSRSARIAPGGVAPPRRGGGHRVTGGGPAGHHRSCPVRRPPAARGSRTGAAAAASGWTRCRRARPGRAVSSAPSASSSHTAAAAAPEPAAQLTRQRADELARRPWHRLGRAPSAAIPGIGAARRPLGPGPGCRSGGGGGGGSWRSTAAAISCAGRPAAAAMSVSWRALAADYGAVPSARPWPSRHGGHQSASGAASRGADARRRRQPRHPRRLARAASSLRVPPDVHPPPRRHRRASHPCDFRRNVGVRETLAPGAELQHGRGSTVLGIQAVR